MENKETKFRFYLNRQGVIGRQGIKGDKGFSPEISVEKDTLSEYILRITNESSYFLTTNLREHKEDRGGTYIRLDRTTGAMYAGEADRATTDTAGVVKMATPDEMMNADENSVVTPANLTDFVTDILVDYVTIAALDNKLLDYAKKVDVQAELAQCVKVTGNQNIAGKKVFSDRVYFNNGISSGKDIYGSNVITPKVTARDSLNGYTPDLINQDGFTLKVGVANNPNAPVNIQNGLRVNYFESEGKPVETVRNGQIYENIDSGNINNFISVDPATVDKAGIVKPDGTSITVDPDGTIHAESGTPSENTMTLDTDQEVNSSKTFLKDQAMKSNTLDVTTARNERGNAFIFSDKNGTQIAGVSSYVNNNGSPECRFIASNGTQSAFAGLGVTKDGQGFFEIPEPAEDSNNNDAVPSSWVNKKLDTKQPKGNYVKTVNNTTPDASGNVNVSGGGDVTKKYVDEQVATKQDKLTPVAPMNIIQKEQKQLFNMALTSDGTQAYSTTNNGYKIYESANNNNLYIQYESANSGNRPNTDWNKDSISSYIDIPYKLGQTFDWGTNNESAGFTFAFGYLNSEGGFIPVFQRNNTAIHPLNIVSNTIGKWWSFGVQGSRISDKTPSQGLIKNQKLVQLYEVDGVYKKLSVSNDGEIRIGDISTNCNGNIKLIDRIRIIPSDRDGGVTSSKPLNIKAYSLYNTNKPIDTTTTLESLGKNTIDLSKVIRTNELNIGLGQGLSVNADGKLEAAVAWDETKAIKITSPFTTPCDGFLVMRVSSPYSGNIQPSEMRWAAPQGFPEGLELHDRAIWFTAYAINNSNHGYVYPIKKGLTIQRETDVGTTDPEYTYAVFLPRKGAQ